MPEIAKNRKATIQTKAGGQFSYTYADLGDIRKQVTPILAKHGLAVAQSITTEGNSIKVATMVWHKGGWAEHFGPLALPGGGDPRDAGSAITYARRYALCAALNLSPEDDLDGAQAAPAPKQEEPPKAEAPPAPDPAVEKSKVGVRAQLKTLIEDGVDENAARGALRAVVDENGWAWTDFATKAKQAKLLAAARDWLAKVDDNRELPL